MILLLFRYISAALNPGKIVVSSPFLDPSGVGYVVTISQAVFEGNNKGMHSTDGRVAAVLALDVAFNAIGSFLLHRVAPCLRVSLYPEELISFISRALKILPLGLNSCQSHFITRTFRRTSVA